MSNEKLAMKAFPTAQPVDANGFTLVELLTAMVIVAILMAVAIPSYKAQTQKSRRTEAKTALLDLASREERFNSTNSSYSSTPSNLGYSGTWPLKVGSGYYQITACVNTTTACATDAGTGQAFLLTAQPVGAQASDTQCGSFTLDSTGLQKVSGTSSGTPSNCWN
ncbi:MAG TPA: type IV pilin protein [Steroidobacteraceae bacterium]